MVLSVRRVEGVLDHPAGGAPVGEVGGAGRQIQPVIRLEPRPRENPASSAKGMLDRSTSTWTERSRVAVRTTLTIQLLSE